MFLRQLTVPAVEGVAGLAEERELLVLVHRAVVVRGRGTASTARHHCDLMVLGHLDSQMSPHTVAAQILLALLAPGRGDGVLLAAVADVRLVVAVLVLLAVAGRNEQVVEKLVFAGGGLDTILNYC